MFYFTDFFDRIQYLLSSSNHKKNNARRNRIRNRWSKEIERTLSFGNFERINQSETVVFQTGVANLSM